MVDFFSTAHQVWQYVALAAVVIALVFSFKASMSPTAERVYRLTAVAVDIQVALGIVLWLAASGWNLGFAQGWLHPITGLAALGVLHAFVGRARKAHPEVAQRTFRTGMIIALVLVVAAIGIAEMA
jgi:heme A synthase